MAKKQCVYLDEVNVKHPNDFNWVLRFNVELQVAESQIVDRHIVDILICRTDELAFGHLLVVRQNNVAPSTYSNVTRIKWDM
jgi:hypothetical protein